MKARGNLVFVGVVVVLALLSCTAGLGPMGSTSSAVPGGPAPLPTQPSNPDMALLHVGVPTVSSVLLDALNATYAPGDGGIGAQAILFASSVRFTLEYPGGSGIENAVWTVGELSYAPVGDEDDDTLLIAAQEVTPGSGLVLTAEVFNSRVSTTVPVVSGSSAPFIVGPGQTTAVRITATPVSPIDLLAEVTDTRSIAQMSYNVSGAFVGDDFDLEFTVNQIGGEQWYRVEPSATGAGRYARVRLDSVNTDVAVFAYNPDGSRIDAIETDAGLGYGFFTGLFAAVSGDGSALPTGTRAGLIIPLFSVGEYTAPGGSFYLGATTLGRNNAQNRSVDVEFDELNYPGDSDVQLLAAPGRPLPINVITDGVLRAIFEEDDDDIYAAESNYHQLVLNEDSFSMDGPNELEFTIELDLLDIWQHTGLFIAEGQDGIVLYAYDAGDPELEVAVFSPESIAIAEGTERDTVVITYIVDPTELPPEVNSEDVGITLFLGSIHAGNGYSVRWVNRSPGFIEPEID